MNDLNNVSVYWFIFFNNQLLLQKKDGAYIIPYGVNPPLPVINTLEVSTINDSPCLAASLATLPAEMNDCQLFDLRGSYDYIEKPMYNMAGKASEIIFWDLHSRFCPACGTQTIQITPIAKQCPNCKYEIYPPVSAAVIVLIQKGNSILLVQARNFRGTFYGLVAGFLETGETLEACVVREVREETGLAVRNIRYFGNQPWPFPSTQMIGFIADYDGGTICLQEEELKSAAFFSRDNLPELPRKLSLARKMIDWWLEQPCNE